MNSPCRYKTTRVLLRARAVLHFRRHGARRRPSVSLRQQARCWLCLYERRHLALAVVAAAAALTLGLVYRRRRTRHRITLVRTASEAQRIVEQWYNDMVHDSSSERVLGLDVEWRSGSQRSAAVLQLSRGTETIVLQLSRFGSSKPAALLQLLADGSILKVGVGIGEDLRRLEKWAASGDGPALACSGGFELVPLAKARSCRGRGLAALSLELLGERLQKGGVRTSDWEARELSAEQVEYAAKDAQTSLRVYRALQSMRARDFGGGSCEHLAVSKRDWFSNAKDDRATLGAAAADRCRADGLARSSRHGVAAAAADTGQGVAPSTANAPHHSVRIPTRTTPVYDGWLMLDPTGAQMCRLSAARGRWYVSRGLAVMVADDDPLAETAPGRTIRLKFTPKGPGNASEPWLL